MNQKTTPITASQDRGLVLTEPSVEAAAIGVAVVIGAMAGPKIPPFQGD